MGSFDARLVLAVIESLLPLSVMGCATHPMLEKSSRLARLGTA